MQDDDAKARRRVFFDVHSELPREAPGNAESTARALALAGPLPPRPLIADVGCGPGAQTLDLARFVPDARIVALDAHAPFLDELRRRAVAAAVADRIDVRLGDMRALPFATDTLDLLWCEGAAYVIGIPEALRLWTPLLKRAGRIALTEPIWLAPDPPPDVVANWRSYPAMTDVDGIRAVITRAGLKLLGDFTLPEAAWWDHYYGPLETRARMLATKYAGDRVAEAVLRDVAAEVDAYRRHSAYFGYQFFVMAR